MQHALDQTPETPAADVLPTECELVAQALADPETFGQIYSLYYPRLFRYVMRTVMNVTHAEDIVADTFLRMIQSLSRFRGEPTRFSAWAYRIATNCMMDHLRRSRRERPVEDLDVNYRRFVDRHLIVETSPRTQLQEFERYLWLHQAIRRLKPSYRPLIVLHYFEDKSPKEIAEIMRCPAATIRWRLHRARKQLERFLSAAKEAH